MQSCVEPNNDPLIKMKALIRYFFTTRIKEYIHNEGTLAKAFNARASINFNGNKHKPFKTSNEVKIALNNIMQKKSEYTYDNDAHETLIAMGCTEEQISFVNVDEMLKYDAILFLANNEVSIMIDKIYLKSTSIENEQRFKKELLAIATNEIMPLLSPQIAIRQALQELHNSVSDSKNPHSALKDAGKVVLDTAQEVISNDLSLDKLAQLTKFVNETSKVVKNLTEENIQHYTNQVQKALEINMNFPWMKVLSGAMLACLGIALIVTSILVAVATFGGVTPLSMLAFPLGSSLVFSGIVLAAATVTGVLAVTGAGFFIAYSKTESLAGTMENLIKTPEFKTAMKEHNIDTIKQPHEHSL